MKKIIVILFAVVISISAISIGIVPAAAEIVDGQFAPDEILQDYERFINPANSDLTIDVSGQYLFDGIFSRGMILIPENESIELFRAPIGYYILIYYSYTSSYYICDSITMYKETGSSVYLSGFLDGEVVYTDIANRGWRIIVPLMPILKDDLAGDVFRRIGDDLTIYRFGDGPSVPAYFVPDQSLPRIFEVWQTVSRWIADGLSSVAGVFYTAGQLTLIGTLAVISVGIALIFLLIAFIRKFLFLRG